MSRRRHSKTDNCYFSEKISFDISYELSTWQTIHMKYQALVSMKKKDQCLL